MTTTSDKERAEHLGRIVTDKEIESDRYGLVGALKKQQAEHEATNGPVEALDLPKMSVLLAQPGRPSIIHRIKGTSPHYEAVATTKKHAELRRDDRGYQPGDYLVINHCHLTDYEFTPRYTGNVCYRKITHVLRDVEGMREGYCVLSVEPISEADSTLQYLRQNPEPEENVVTKRTQQQIEAELKRRREETEKLTSDAAKEAWTNFAGWKATGPDRIVTTTIHPRVGDLPIFSGHIGDQVKITLPKFKPKNGFEAFRSISEELPTSGAFHEVDESPIPDGIYYCGGNFFRVSDAKGMGNEFYRAWRHRAKDFPETRQEAHDKQLAASLPPPVPDRLPAKSVVTHHENELLLHLTQEASEVIQSITKLQFFGKETVVYRGKSYNNRNDLSLEVGNLLHMIDVVTACGLLDEAGVKVGRQNKQLGLDKHLTKK